MKKLLLSIALVSLPMTAFADFSCQGVPNQVLVYGDGSVNVFQTPRGDYTYICNLTTPRLGVDPVTCAMWTALLLSAKKDNRVVSFYYSGNVGCTALPVYSNSPAPYYIG